MLSLPKEVGDFLIAVFKALYSESFTLLVQSSILNAKGIL